MKKILLLGSGELGKEFVIAAMRAGQYVIACDRYDNAPAMQVADEREVFNMLDGDALEAVVNKHKPDIIVPEIEAIRTERLFKFEEQGVQVVPSARAVNYTMNRRAIRDLAAKELGLRTAKYFYAKTCRRNRFPLRGEAPHVVQRSRSELCPQRRRARDGFPGGHGGFAWRREGSHHRGVHRLRLGVHAAHRHPAARLAHAVLPAHRSCAEGWRLP